MAMMYALWLLVALAPLSSSAESVTLKSILTSSEYHQNKLHLRCLGGSGNALLFRRIGNSSMAVLSMSMTTVPMLIFELDHRTEGVYYCRDGSTTSSEMLFVAYPYPDPNPTRSYSANIGDDLRMNCTIPRGVLTDRYSVRWFKGLKEIDTDSSSHFSLDGFALVFSGVEASDYGNGYYCNVSVRVNGDSIVTRQGSTIALNIMVPLQLISGLKNAAVLVGEDLRLTCHAEGVPTPTFRWLMNGQQQESGVTNSEVSRANAVSMESEYVITDVVEDHTGPVTCVALHERNGTIFTASSTANIVVLTNVFKVTLALQRGELLLRGQLAVLITGAFTLKIRFYNSDTMNEESFLCDPSLADTDEIDVVIGKEIIPKSFRDFTVAVAIVSNGRPGPFTLPSNRIVLASTPSTCECSNNRTPSASGGNTTLIVVVVIFIVILLLVIAAMVVGCVIFYMKGVAICRSGSASYYSSRSSLPHSRSHSSRSNESSASRGRSHSQASADRHDGDGVELEVFKKGGETRMPEYECVDKKVDGPRDEPLDHKGLQQWKRSEHNHPPGSPPLKLESVPQVHLREAALPQTHIGGINCATNPIFHHRNRERVDRESQSPFEDLEDAAYEFSTQVPRSC